MKEGQQGLLAVMNFFESALQTTGEMKQLLEKDRPILDIINRFTALHLQIPCRSVTGASDNFYGFVVYDQKW